MVRHVISLWVYEWSQPYMDWCPSTVFCWMVVSHSVFCGSTRFLSEIACCAVKPNNGCEEVFIKIYMIYFHSINFVTSAARISRYRQILNGWNSHASTSVRRLMSVWCPLLMWILFIKMNSWDVPTGLSLRLWLTGKYRYKFFVFSKNLYTFSIAVSLFFRSDKLLIAHEIWKNNVCKKLNLSMSGLWCDGQRMDSKSREGASCRYGYLRVK